MSTTPCLEIRIRKNRLLFFRTFQKIFKLNEKISVIADSDNILF
jgi:hypothetical protein